MTPPTPHHELKLISHQLWKASRGQLLSCITNEQKTTDNISCVPAEKADAALLFRGGGGERSNLSQGELVVNCPAAEV